MVGSDACAMSLVPAETEATGKVGSTPGPLLLQTTSSVSNLEARKRQRKIPMNVDTYGDNPTLPARRLLVVKHHRHDGGKLKRQEEAGTRDQEAVVRGGSKSS